METKQKLVRTTDIRLNSTELVDAIRMYLKSKGVKDTDQHVVINIIETRGDAGTICDVIINNYDKDKNLSKHIE